MDVEGSRDVEDNPPYVTILPARFDQACVAIMKWSYTNQEYAISKISQAVTQNAAVHLAASWAAAMNMEIR